MVVPQARQRCIACLGGENRHRLPFQKEAELERVLDQTDIHMRHQHAPLRNGLDEAFGLKAGNEFADGAERQAGQLHELALRNELARLDVARQKVVGETLVGSFPEVPPSRAGIGLVQPPQAAFSPKSLS